MSDKPDDLQRELTTAADEPLLPVEKKLIVGSLLVFFKHRLGWGSPDKLEQEHITLTDR